MEDNRIVALYWARDDRAIDESRRKYGGYCMAIAGRILARQQDAEESVNDTWLGAWNAMPPHRPTVLATFLGKLTRRIALKRWEAERAQKRGGDTVALALEELGECVDGSGDVQQAVEATALAECINAFVLALPQRERTAFLRRYWYLQGITEIAEALSMTESAVKSMLHRTRLRLREKLEQEGFTV